VSRPPVKKHHVKKAAPQIVQPQTPAASPLTPVATEPDGTSLLAQSVPVILLMLPVLLFLVALVPARVMPQRLVVGWIDRRLELGMFAGSLLLIEGFLYALVK
jgi:hypothetical protein